eukprot:TRINITY_DN14020_c0_g1_i1.p1 TRINITY_DN14020_c0_g1~~TRINITY_DN14020_c0_g1_i1.p1  ORF type:complete len:326 (-),score=51.98 TRINITY_DN14020_c0_g1_i1:808-1785(-)
MAVGSFLNGLPIDSYLTDEDTSGKKYAGICYRDVEINFCGETKEEDTIEIVNVELLDRIGEGAFSDVYKARITPCVDNTPEFVAVKILKARRDNLSAFKRELSVMKKLRSLSGLLPLVGYRTSPHYWIITPFIADGNLSKQKQLLSVDQKIDLMIKIAQTMKRIQAEGFMHRDLTTENVMVDRETSRIFLADFGLALDLRDFEEFSHDLYHISPDGNPRFRAPEISESTCGLKSEIYNFGSCLYEVLSGKFPFQEVADSKDVLRFVDNGLRPILADDSQLEDPVNRVWNLVESCWSDYSSRPSWDKIIEELKAAHLFQFTDTCRV